MNILSDAMDREQRARGERITRRPVTARSSLLVAAALAAASLGAVAQTVTPLSRADVSADLQRARAAGEIERSMSESFGLVWLQDRHPGESARSAAADKAPRLARAQVRAELMRAIEAGEMDDAGAEMNVRPLGQTSPSSAFSNDTR